MEEKGIQIQESELDDKVHMGINLTDLEEDMEQRDGNRKGVSQLMKRKRKSGYRHEWELRKPRITE